MRQRNGAFRLEELELRDVPGLLLPDAPVPLGRGPSYAAVTVATPDHWHARVIAMPIWNVSSAHAAATDAGQAAGVSLNFPKIVFQDLNAGARIGPIIDT